MKEALITGYNSTTIFTKQGTIDIQKGTKLKLSFSSEKFCTGYKLPAKDPVDCPNHSLAEKGNQCLDCLDKAATLPCVRCIGRTCSNKIRRSSCILVPHYVYLAFYTPDLIKVGVTKVDRLEMRIREQGALGALVIAGSGGQEVRMIEHNIAKAGWKDRTNLLPMLADDILPSKQIHDLLLKEQYKIEVSLPVLDTLPGKYIYLADNYPQGINSLPTQVDISKDKIFGEVMGVRGSFLIYKEEYMLLTCKLKHLVGHKVTINDDIDFGISKVSLF